MVEQRFVGIWKLVSWNQLVDGATVAYLGAGATGVLIYSVDGRMSAQIMAANRSRMGMPPERARNLAMNLLRPWKAREAAKGLGAVFRYFRASLSYVAYAGTYEVVGDEVIHHVDMSLIPDWTGTDQRRRFRFECDGSRLVLIAPNSDATNEHTLTWNRAEAFGLTATRMPAAQQCAGADSRSDGLHDR